MEVIAHQAHPYLRTASPRDVDAINALYFDEYGQRYPYPLTSERLASGVHLVVEMEGRVAAFARACPCSGHARVFELGGLIVHRTYRRHRLADLLTAHRLEGVRDHGGRLAVAEPVCWRTDVASQKNLLHHRFTLLGILPYKYPDLLHDYLGTQPETVALGARMLQGEHGERRRPIFLPAEYAALGAMLSPGFSHPPHCCEPMRVPMPPTITEAAIPSRHWSGSEYLDIPCNWPEALDAIADARRDGFGLAAFLPGFGHLADGTPFDYVRLYRPERRGTFSLVHVHPSLAPLKAFMEQEAEDMD